MFVFPFEMLVKREPIVNLINLENDHTFIELLNIVKCGYRPRKPMNFSLYPGDGSLILLDVGKLGRGKCVGNR